MWSLYLFYIVCLLSFDLFDIVFDLFDMVFDLVLDIVYLLSLMMSFIIVLIYL
ncbi:hypothetical protein BY996DRAFT_1021202 [Phakopsora pachyrhizi]|nr:hypothetical protein BY996DRAFT_1021202 [Phakopsora pachyrhizi]